MIASARMYSWSPSLTAAWRRLLEWVSARAGVPLEVMDQSAPTSLDELWARENRQLEVRLTSAVALEPEIVKRLGAEIERQTDRNIELSSEVDESIIGGLVLQVGNMVLDASVRNKLERLRKEVAQAA